MRFLRFLTETHQPVVETPDERELRLRRGYRKIVRVDAAAFQKRYAQDQKQALAWHPARIAAVAGYATYNGYPMVSFGNGRLDVIDGRHRLASAASRQATIDVAVRPEVNLPDELLA
jgi:hypothetical protein